MTGSTGAPMAAGDAIRRLIGILDDAGFEPEAPADPTAPIRLRRCPFEALAHDHQTVVCGVHLGLMRGALRALGAPLDAVRLEPFVEPGVCLAHLEVTRMGHETQRCAGRRSRLMNHHPSTHRSDR